MSKRNIILSMILVMSILVITVSITYAFFQAQGGETVVRNVNVQTHTVDLLSFEVDENISIEATQTNFINGGNNLSGESVATAILTPNSKTGEATRNYYLYIKIDDNGLKYSAENTNKEAELLLQVFNENDQLVTLTGLGNQVTVNTLTGYDITGKFGLIPVVENQTITASNGNPEEQEWRIVVTLINHDFSQNDNAGKRVEASIIIQEEELVLTHCEEFPNDLMCYTMANYVEPTNVSEREWAIYYHDENLENGAGDGSYRYSGENPNNYICMDSSVEPCPIDKMYRIIGFMPVDVVVDDSDPDNIVTETKTLYKLIMYSAITNAQSELNINICRAGLTSTIACPGNNYSFVNTRFCGVPWSGANNNNSDTWSESQLNTALNTTFLTQKGIDGNIIADVLWKVGGTYRNYVASALPSNIYTAEITNSGVNQSYYNAPVWIQPKDGKMEYVAKVGLMYISDYAYAPPNSSWGNIFNTDSNNGYYNWMSFPYGALTITRNSVQKGYEISVRGKYIESLSGRDGYSVVRPVFYLNEDTFIYRKGHTGTVDDPYRLG